MQFHNRDYDNYRNELKKETIFKQGSKISLYYEQFYSLHQVVNDNLDIKFHKRFLGM